VAVVEPASAVLGPRQPFQLDGVWVTWAQKVAEMIAAPGPLTLEKVTDLGNRLARGLPPGFA
jgi:hypothetical protein